MRSGKLLISVALLMICRGATAAIPQTEAQKTVERVLSREPLKSAVCGVLAVRMDGDTLANVNRSFKLLPASNMKLITTGLALRTLGSSYRFETKLGYVGEIRDSVLVGDLYIVGGADPTTGSKSDCAEPLASLFGKWAGLLKSAGIKGIEGRIVGDPRYFDDPTPENMGWSYDDIGTYYGTGPTGLNFYENAQNFYVTPGAVVGIPPFVRPRYPETPWMKYINSARTSASRSSNTLSYVDSDFGPYGEIRGEFPLDRGAYTLECSNKFGAYTCAYYFHKYLTNNGFSVSKGYADVSLQGQVRTSLEFGAPSSRAADQKDVVILGSTLSPMLADIVSDTNHDSDNFFAETLLRTIGKVKSGSCTYDKAISAAESLLASMGLRVKDACQIFDGSGLSRKNYVSPDFFVRFLRAMTRSDVYADYLRSLPVPGHEGTLKARLQKAPVELKDRIHMKSGSMNGVVCFSGYITASDGKPEHTVAFSVMTNNSTGSSWTVYSLVDEIIAALAAEN